MFNGCNKLKEIRGFNTFNIMNVKYMNALFQGCKELENIDLSNFNTSNVINMEAMFSNCSNLQHIIGLEKFNTINANNMA